MSWLVSRSEREVADGRLQATVVMNELRKGKKTSTTPDKIMQIGMGFWASKVLLSAVEMEVFTELAKHPEDLAAIAENIFDQRQDR